MLVNRLSRVLMPVLLLAQIGVANADLRLLKPDPAIPATAVGSVGYSADGLGQDGVGGTVQAEVPPGSTVLQAYLYGTYVFNENPVSPDTDIDFDGTPVTLVEVPGSQPGLAQFATARANVTSQVAAKVGSGGGITDFSVNTDPASLSGVSLVAIYWNAALPTTTIAVLDGGALQAGDVTTFIFNSPLDKTIPGFAATLSLGSGHSFQEGGPPTHECGAGFPQSSLVAVNGTRLTSCVGNFDDGFAEDGGLITTGGVGDSTSNPAFPLQQPGDGSTPRGEDDELYNIEALSEPG